ncbi:hypothetical protein AAFF_G00409670 [Aldrovandia affinis]|uniref:Uncharacterized protein n=1 Tax=Aldrovandia affinis TaxID=143900 RepID=A0AAD7SBH3_9TELE|nr:hypothetical protein AAFF_G00409670 [Aldrovandia affinis]
MNFNSPLSCAQEGAACSDRRRPRTATCSASPASRRREFCQRGSPPPEVSGTLVRGQRRLPPPLQIEMQQATRMKQETGAEGGQPHPQYPLGGLSRPEGTTR